MNKLYELLKNSKEVDYELLKRAKADWEHMESLKELPSGAFVTIGAPLNLPDFGFALAEGLIELVNIPYGEQVKFIGLCFSDDNDGKGEFFNGFATIEYQEQPCEIMINYLHVNAKNTPK